MSFCLTENCSCLCHACRLPILQGGTFALVTPAMAMLSMPEWKCPAWTQNASLVNTSSPLFIEVWQTRMRTVSRHKHCAFTAFDKIKPTKTLSSTSAELMINSVSSCGYRSVTSHIVVYHSSQRKSGDVNAYLGYCVPVHSCRALSWWPLSSRSWSVSLASSASSCASLAP